MKTFILLLFFGFQAFSTLKAQQIFTGNGTSSSTFFLGNVDYARKSQCLYPPSVLSNEVSGKIKRIYFRYGTGTTNQQVLTDFKVKFGQTNNTTIPGITFYTDLTTVLDTASYTIPAGPNGSWFSIKVDSMFNYDPTKSIIVEVSFEASTVQIWGTLGSSNTPTRKLISPNPNALTGDASSGSVQDFGFDVIPTITGTAPTVFTNNIFTIFPNPAFNSIQVRFKDRLSGSAPFSIRNQVGKTVITGDLSDQSEIDTHILSPGAYFMETEFDKKVLRQSFIKLK